MENKRSSFTGKIGFVLAAAGSAVGLGNIWRFPYLAAKYGGGIFLLVYLILAVTFGFSLMCAEIAIGRKTGQSAIGAFTTLNKKYKFIGVMASAVPIIILPYYSVVISPCQSRIPPNSTMFLYPSFTSFSAASLLLLPLRQYTSIS
jgi:NSS family neurotransmitter:Na+ symporter